MTTMEFTSTVNTSRNIPVNSDATIVNQDFDTDSKGGPVGFDTMYVTHGRPGDNSMTADAAFAFAGGFLYATFSTADGQTWTGQVTGGSGKFKGATGTVTATTTNDSPYPWVWTELQVMLDYS
jgi:hypothetical protein